jgi:FkbM family methyltransferase
LLAVEAYVYQIETIRKTIKSAGIKVIFDIGAHIGTYSMLLNKAYSGAKIFCFEPNPITFNILNNNLSGVDGVMLYNIGFSDESGCLQIYYKNKALDSATFEAQRAIEEKNEDLIECKIETLNNFIDISGVKEIDILKIDVEGHEKKVLLSAKNALKITKFLIIEISLNLDFSFSDVIKLFNSDSYNFTLVKIIKVWKNSDGSLAIIELLLKNNNL